MIEPQPQKITNLDPKAEQVRRSQLLAHDIRSALGGVLGGLSLIDDKDFSDRNKMHFSRASAAADMLLGLLDENVGFIVDPTADVPNTDGFPLPEMLEQLRARWEGEAAAKGIQLVFNLAKTLPASLTINALDFQRIFNNIIGNAVKFTRSGAVGVDFTTDGDSGLVCKVSDNGPGFSDCAAENLFAFQGRPESLGQPGAGLGLHIAKVLVDQAGGSIDARNLADGGALVMVSLPVPENERTRLVSVAGGLPDLSHLKILMAEDNLTNQMVAVHMLKAMNVECVVAADGVEAVEKFELEDFDIALIDIEMPRMSGLEVMRAIRQRKDEKAATPLVALTAYVLPEHQERIRAAGASGLISKPLADIGEFGRSILSFAESAPKAINNHGKAIAPVEGCIDMAIYNGLAEMIGDESMLELLGKVKSDIGGVKTKIANGLVAKSNDIIGSNTHILISVAGAIGATDLQNQAQSLNSLSKTTNWDTISVAVQKCVSGCDVVLTFVESKLQSV